MAMASYLKTEPTLATAGTEINRLYLTVNDLEKQIAFYTSVLQMKLFEQTEQAAVLGSESTPFLHLIEDKKATRDMSATGLYHFAILYPSDEELARIIVHLIQIEYMNYPTDHAMSKTTYLKDAEGNDIELYVRSLDRVKFETVNGEIEMYNADGSEAETRAPLDLNDLISHITSPIDPNAVMPAGTTLGHVHIYSRSLEEMLAFYRDLIGFGESMTSTWFKMGEVALEDGRNHIIAFNTWKGEDAPLVADGALGLKYYVLRVSQEDFDGIRVRLASAGAQMSETEAGIVVKDPANVELLIEVAK